MKQNSIQERKQVSENTDSIPDPEKEKKAAVKKAMDLLLYKDRSAKELRNRLVENGYSPGAVETALGYVRSFGYLNDKRYAENYVYSMRNKKSRRMMYQYLEEQEIPAEYIEEALKTMPSDEKERIYDLLIRKAGQSHTMDEKELRRCFAFLARKGFSSSDIWSVIHRYQSVEE